MKRYFIAGMKKWYEMGVIKYSQIGDESLLGLTPETKADSNFRDVYELSQQIQNNLENDINKSICLAVLELFIINMTKFISKLNSDQNDQLIFKPFWVCESRGPIQ